MPRQSKAAVKAEHEEYARDVTKVAAATFEPWQRDFAKWLVGKEPTVPMQLAKLKELSKLEWTPARLRDLRRATLFREYLRVLKEGGVPLARERLAEIAPKAVDHIEWAMDAAKKAEDYATMPKITGQILERVIPRRDDLTQQRLTINIALSEKQKALLDAPALDAEFEPLD